MKQLLFTAIFLVYGFVTYSQNISYLETDTLVNYGVNLINKGSQSNAILISVQRGNNIIEYTPYEVQAYRFHDGTTYISRDFSFNGESTRLFIEELVKGDLSLYYLKSSYYTGYFLEKDSIFYQVPKVDEKNKSFHSTLENLSKDFLPVQTLSNLVRYNRFSMIEFVTRYNNEIESIFPRSKPGLIIGTELQRLRNIPFDNISSGISDSTFLPAFRLGLNYSLPIYKEYVSLQPELNFVYLATSFQYAENSDRYDGYISTGCLKTPILLRFSFPNKETRLFADLGFQTSFKMLDNSVLYHTLIDNNTITLNTIQDDPQNSGLEFSTVMGIGIEHFINPGSSIILSLRYEKYTIASLNIDRSIVLFTGIIF